MSDKILFCVVVKRQVVRAKSGRAVIGEHKLIKRFLKAYGRGASMVRYRGQEIRPVR